MSEFNFKITSYSIHLGERARDKAETLEGKEVEVVITKVLTCRGDAGERITVHFYQPAPERFVMKSLFHEGEGGKPSAIIWAETAAYMNFIDLVRNESPVWGYIETGEGSTEARLYTGRWEPAGVGDEDYRSNPTG